ncbi:hypothetical protein SAMN03159339_5232 [Variovorax sp. 770b2]|nr:hypothetical protein SAMN03159339_5232 [Variovorax sp. 770b2]
MHPQQRYATNVPMAKLPPNIARLYHQQNLKFSPETHPAFTNANLMNRPFKVGSGAFNTVYAVQLKKPDGGVLDGVFKPLSITENGWVAAATGIPRNDPQIAMRNIATLSYAKKLDVDVIPDTHVAALEVGPGAQIEGPKLGLVMEKALGMEAGKAPIEMLERRDVCAEVTKLQLLDHLTGQGDRHSGNYFIDVIKPSDEVKVMGIDNDQCFGHRLTNPNEIQFINNRTNYGFRGTSLPPVVDFEMAIKISSLTPSDIQVMLGDKLSEAEVRAAVARLEGVKKHIVQLEAQGRVIDPKDWDHFDVRQLLTAENSYIGRERERALAKQAQALDPQRPNAGW